MQDSENEAGEKLAAGDAGDKVVAAASKVLAAVDLDELAEYLAHKSPEEGPGAETRKQQMEERKAAVIAAYLAAAKIHVDRAFPKVRLNPNQGLELGTPNVARACLIPVISLVCTPCACSLHAIQMTHDHAV